MLDREKASVEAPSAGPLVQQSNWISFSWTSLAFHVSLR